MIGDLSDSATPFGRRLPSKEEIAENGLYYYFLPPLEREFYSAALKDPGLENVIACLQETIVSVLEGDPRNYHLLPRAFTMGKPVVIDAVTDVNAFSQKPLSH